MWDEEGKVEVDGHQVWYRRVGEGGVPLLLLHGGPGAGHDYLERVHILGQSWGGWLAIEYMLNAPQGVEGLVLASTSASISQFVDEAQRLISEMPEAISDALRRHEAAGEYDHPDFVAALEEFCKRHLCRLSCVGDLRLFPG